MRVYETTYIVTPDLQQADYETIIKKFNQLLADNGAKITHQELWGIQKLAYEIEAKTSGYYVFTEFQSDNIDINAKLEQEYIYDERLMRFLTVRLDKFAREWNEKRKAKLSTAASAA